MNVAIVGAGAMGCFVASRLVEVDGVDVTLVGRPRFVDAFATRGGLQVNEEGDISVIGDITPASEIGADADLVILTVKSYDSEDTANQVLAAYGVDTPVLSLQNGVGNEQTLVETGFTRVLAGSLTTPVSVLGPANIRIDKASSSVGLASWTSPADGDLVNVFDMFDRSTFEATRYGSAKNLKWTKLLMNMVGNASSAILDQTPDVVFSDARLVNLEIGAWREALRVMSAAGVAPVKVGSYPFRLLGPAIRYLPKPVIRPIMRSQVIGGRGKKMPSLHIDVHRGRGRSEVAWLNGAVAQLGDEVGVDTPINRLFTETVESMVSDPTKWDSNRLFEAAR